MLFGYARVSHFDQNIDRQIDALKECGIDERLIYIDKFTGSSIKRPQFDKLLTLLVENDELTVLSLDRLTRSIKDLWYLMELFAEKKIMFKSLRENIDFKTPTGRLIIGTIGLQNQFLREITLLNAQEGIRAGKARGKKFGRPKLLNDYELTCIKIKLDEGKTIPEIAKDLNITRQTIYNYLNR